MRERKGSQTLFDYFKTITFKIMKMEEECSAETLVHLSDYNAVHLTRNVSEYSMITLLTFLQRIKVVVITFEKKFIATHWSFRPVGLSRDVMRFHDNIISFLIRHVSDASKVLVSERNPATNAWAYDCITRSRHVIYGPVRCQEVGSRKKS
jgi:hypothetical protein